MPRRNSSGEIVFGDYPEFRPNLTPREIFLAGAFGGTYWRPIHSSINKKDYKNQHKKYAQLNGIDKDLLVRDWSDYDKNINKYGVKVGTTLRFWETHHWIETIDPYGWIQWYCAFYEGRRCYDDERQIKRWLATAGPESRFRKNLIRQIYQKTKKYNDFDISPRIRQTLLHWAYELTSRDYNAALKNKWF